MIKRLLKLEECCFMFPNENHSKYYSIFVKDGIAKLSINNTWKEIKIFDDGFTNLIEVCEMLIGQYERKGKKNE